jgi:hypothetical protein
MAPAALPATVPEHVIPADPSGIALYPHTFPIEVALQTAPIQQICASYGITHAEWQRLRVHPVFVADVRNAYEALKKDGARFRIKAGMQAEALLGTIWKFIHAPPAENVPPSVKADLAKFVVRAAGYDASQASGAAAAATLAPTLNIQINL